MAENTKTLQVVERTFQVLEALAKEGSMSLADLHGMLSVNKASLLRLLTTLISCGYVKKDETTGNYSLTMKLYEIGSNAVQSLDKFSLINSTLVDLSEKTGRIAQFSVEDNNEVLCLLSIGQRTPNFSAYTNTIGRSPLYATSAGKAMLATYTNMQILEKWKSFNVQPLTEHTILDVQDLLQEIGVVRQKQYAVDHEENEYNVCCVGTVVFGADRKPLGAISLSGTTLTEEEEKTLSAQLLESVHILSGMLGYIA